MAVLDWMHHTLIQSLMTRGPLKEDDFHKIFAGVAKKNPRKNERDFNDFLLTINKELLYVQMELRRCRNQNDGQVCYGLVNNVSDEQSKLGTKYSVPQIAFFKCIIDAIVQDATAHGSISAIDVLNLRLESQTYVSFGSLFQMSNLLPVHSPMISVVSKVHTGTESQLRSKGVSSQVPPVLRNFSMSQKEKTLDELVHDKWLFHSSDGNIGLGVRSYLDLQSWFHKSGTPLCEVCSEAAIKAKVCTNDDCTIRIHHYCLQKIFSLSRGNIVCPSCGIQWECQIPKTEAIVVDDEQNEPTESQPPAGSKRKRLKKTNRNANADTVACGSSQGSHSVSDPRRVTRSSS